MGMPLPLLSFRLEAVPDMGYDPAADPPRGEVIMKGPVVFRGYYQARRRPLKNPSKTLSSRDAGRVRSPSGGQASTLLVGKG